MGTKLALHSDKQHRTATQQTPTAQHKCCSRNEDDEEGTTT